MAVDAGDVTPGEFFMTPDRELRKVYRVVAGGHRAPADRRPRHRGAAPGASVRRKTANPHLGAQQMNDTRDSRRRFLKGIVATAALASLSAGVPAHAADPPKLAEEDPAAKALGYVANAGKVDPAKEAAFRKGSTCGNCALYQAAQETGGFAPCALFPGKAVARGGWCRVWTVKPA